MCLIQTRAEVDALIGCEQFFSPGNGASFFCQAGKRRELILLLPTPFVFELLKFLTGARRFQNSADDAYCEDGNHENTSQKSDS
jgi:hypothetical protein